MSDPGADSDWEKTDSATIEDVCELIEEGCEDLILSVSVNELNAMFSRSTHGISGASGR